MFYETSVATAAAGRSFPATQTGATKAMITEPLRHATSPLANLLTRTRRQERAPTGKTEPVGTQAPSPVDLDRSDSLTLDLWSSRISAPDAGDDVETSLALKRLIRQVQRMTSNDKVVTPPSAPPAEATPTAEPSILPAAVTEGVQTAQAQTVADPASETVSAAPTKAQKTLADLRRNPGRVRDPLEAAELLFLSGRASDAAPFYEEALRRVGPGATGSSEDRAWILFQLGNCLRETDATKARDTYAKLIAECPDSPWTEMARASGRLLTWYQSSRPDQLLEPAR